MGDTSKITIISTKSPLFLKRIVVLSMSATLMAVFSTSSNACNYVVMVDNKQKCVGYSSSDSLDRVDQDVMAHFYEQTSNLDVLSSFYVDKGENALSEKTITVDNQSLVEDKKTIVQEAVQDSEVLDSSVSTVQNLTPSPVSVLNLAVIKDFYSGGKVYTDNDLNQKKNTSLDSEVSDSNQGASSTKFNIVDKFHDFIDFFSLKKN